MILKPAATVRDIGTAICSAIAMAGTALLLAVVSYSVISRAIFDLSGGSVALMLPGAIEAASYALAITVMAAIPAALSSGLIAVDILTGKLSGVIAILLDRLWYAAIFAFALALIWLLGEETATTFARGDTTQDLGISLYIIYAALTVEAVMLGVIALCTAIAGPGEIEEVSL